MVYSSIPLAQAVITLCLSKGIDHVVISPGSRNAPLTIGFSHHPKIQAYSIVDERCAAFLLLGSPSNCKGRWRYAVLRVVRCSIITPQLRKPL